MRSSIAVLACGVFGALLTSCSGSPRRDLQVMSYTPQGPVDQRVPVEIKFDQPVVDEATVGKPVAPGSVAITPEIAWKGFWHDRQTLTVEPTAPLAPSTRYRVALSGELASRTHGFQFAFVHKPLAVEGLVGVDTDALIPEAALPLSFNQLVRPGDAAAHCKLTPEPKDGAARAAIALTVPGTAPEITVGLVPTQPLGLGKTYTLSCAGLTGAGGDVALETPYTATVRVRPGLEVTGFDPAGDDVSPTRSRSRSRSRPRSPSTPPARRSRASPRSPTSTRATCRATAPATRSRSISRPGPRIA